MRNLQLFAYLWGLTLKKHRRIMKKMTLIFAAIGLLLCACEKEQNSAKADDLVGEWENTLADFGQTMKFEKDGTYIQVDGEYELKGKWELKGSVLTILTPAQEEGEMERLDLKVKLIGGKAALVTESANEDEAYHSLYYKKGAQVKSGALKDGRYDAPHNGKKGTGNYDRTITFIVKGNQLDLYIHAWGTHLQGTYTIENGYLKFNATKGWYGQDTVEGGWFAGYADIDFENFTFGNKNYQWLEGMQYQDAFSSFPLCVTDDGKDAYMSAVGLTRWLFLR